MTFELSTKNDGRIFVPSSEVMCTFIVHTVREDPGYEDSLYIVYVSLFQHVERKRTDSWFPLTHSQYIKH